MRERLGTCVKTAITATDRDALISVLFDQIDADKNGVLSFTELHEGFKRFCNIYVTQFDWCEMTNSIGTTSSGEGTHSLSKQDFRNLLLEQLKLHLLKTVNLEIAGGNDQLQAVLPVLKWLVIALDSKVHVCARTRACSSLPDDKLVTKLSPVCL